MTYTWGDADADWGGGSTWAGAAVGTAVPKVEIEFPDTGDVSTWGDSGTTWGDDTYAWGGQAQFVNVNQWAQSIKVTRGRQHELDRVETGVTAARLLNTDRRFDPANEASPYYPNVRPMRRLRVTATRDGGVVYAVSTGAVEGWPLQWQTTEITVSDIVAADALKSLGLQDWTASRISESTSDRVTYLLDNAGWPAERRRIEAGIVTMPARSYSGTSFLAALQEAAAAEGGALFVSKDGDIVFHNRDHRLANFQTSQVTLGGSSGLPYHRIETSYDDADLANEVRATASSSADVGGDGSADGVEVIATDAASQAKYGRRVLRLGEVKTGQLVAQDTVDYHLNRRSEPLLRFSSVTVQPTAHESLWRYVLDLELGDRLTVVLEPSTGDPITREVHLEQVVHRITPGWWETDWAFTPADEQHYWELDTNDSALDSTTRVGY